MKAIYLTVFYCFILNCYLVQSIKDPYEILDVKKTASINEIKRNYKNLIKVWHPDNNNVEAEAKFLEINEAYKLLMDPDRREDYDKNKITVDSPNFRKIPDYSSLKRFELEDEDYFSKYADLNEDETKNNNKTWRLNHMDILYKQTISYKAYSNKIVPASTKHPQLILFYSDSRDQCEHCSSVAVIWQRISNELFPIGIHLHTINVDKDVKLARKIGINTNQLPSIIGITDETIKFFKEEQISLHKIILFIRRILRNTLVKKINHSNLKEFLKGWRSDNKIRILFANQDKNIHLRYLVAAYKYREYATCGHIWIENSNQFKTNNKDNKTYLSPIYSTVNFVELIKPTTVKPDQDIVNKFKLDASSRYMLIFNENTSWPEVILTSPDSTIDFKAKQIWDTIESNKFLLFPKITSQTNFEQICGVESIRSKRILCTILITSKKDNDLDQEMNTMREFIKRNMFNRKKFKFAYITLEDQKPFLSALITNQTRNSTGSNSNYSFKKYFNDENNRLKGNENMNENTKDVVIQSDAKLIEFKLSVVVITRKKWDHISFEWLDGKWNTKNGDDLMNKTQNKLYELLIRLSSPEVLNTDFSYETKIIPLIDENEKTIFGRIIHKLFILIEHLSEHFTKREILQIISVILSILFIFLIGYTMQYLVKIEEQKIDENYKKLGKIRPDLAAKLHKANLQNRLLIHELRGETYNGLIRLLKPGCRTIVLLCDSESKTKLLPKFYKTVFPYRRNKTLNFAYLMVDKNINWYRRILEQALDKQKSLFLNPKNCIGTVLSLNGFRRYFCVYHAKHMESRNNMNDGNNSDDFSESETSDVESGNLLNKNKNLFNSKQTVLIDDLLLDGLSDWLDKLFSSKTHKYFINYWPTSMR